MSRILFYSPFNQRSRDTESLMIAFHKQGHEVISLSQGEGYLINDFLNANGVKAYSYVLSKRQASLVYYLQHLVFFIRFCWRHRINVVYSHLESANFVASIGQFFIQAKVYLCRHHIDLAAIQKFDTTFFYRITYGLARRIIVVSHRARRYMIDRERIGKKKIIHINLAYDFNLYSRPEKTEVQKIREMNSAQVVMISIGRFNSYKRVDLAVQVLKIIIENGVDARLILLGEGPERGKIEMLIRDYALQSKVIMPGYVPNIIDYLAASDFLLHPSVSESSCVVVKEAAIVGVPVIVCEKVGDFDEYIVNEANGFVISQANFAQEAAEIILSKFAQKEALGSVTATLRKDVMKLFSLESVLPQYEMLNNRAE